MLRRSGVCAETLTSKLNKGNAAAALRKWGQPGSPSKGIPQRARDEMQRITILHETSRIIVAGRNRVNHFNGNQYAIIAKQTNRAVLIDMCDDWADDWHIFLEAAGATVEVIFFTHLHMDNLLGLPAFLHFRPNVPLAWNMADMFWAKKWSATCARYGRPDLGDQPLPFHEPLFAGSMDYETRKQLSPNIADVTGLVRCGRGGRHILLTSDSNRLSPTFILSKDLALYHIHTPGHSMGHQCLYIPQEHLLFSGDLLFHEKIGRVDLPHGCGALMAQSLRSLEDLPDQTVLLPGHGKLSTLAHERKYNPGLQRVYELMRAGVEDPHVGANTGFF